MTETKDRQTEAYGYPIPPFESLVPAAEAPKPAPVREYRPARSAAEVALDDKPTWKDWLLVIGSLVGALALIAGMGALIVVIAHPPTLQAGVATTTRVLLWVSVAITAIWTGWQALQGRMANLIGGAIAVGLFLALATSPSLLTNFAPTG